MVVSVSVTPPFEKTIISIVFVLASYTSFSLSFSSSSFISLLAISSKYSVGKFSKLSALYLLYSSSSKIKILFSKSSLVLSLSVLVLVVDFAGEIPSVLFLLACIDAESAPISILETPDTSGLAFVSVFSINSSIPTSLPYETLKFLDDNTRPFLLPV